MSASEISHDTSIPFPYNKDGIDLPECKSRSPLIQLEVRGRARIITLNRPSAFHALNMEMITSIRDALTHWASSPYAQVIIIRSVNPVINKKTGRKTNVFCAGGDVVTLLQENAYEGKISRPIKFLYQEYALNHYIATYCKPIVSLIDGITMGGGAGISAHTAYRVATENTVFAMPETSIGYFPDVGASFFMTRLLDTGMCRYLALTGKQILSKDVYNIGIATHFVNSKSLENIVDALSFAAVDDVSSIKSILNSFMVLDEESDLSSSWLDLFNTSIEKCFGEQMDNFMSILQTLQSMTNDSDKKDWAKETLKILETVSPTSLLITFELMNKAFKTKSIKQCLQMEANACLHIVPSHDFKEGVETKLIKKLNQAPNWNPPSLSNIDQKSVSQWIDNTLFPLEFLNEIDFDQYPHQKNSMPTLSAIREKLESKSLNHSQVISWISSYHGLKKKMDQFGLYYNSTE